MDKLSLKIICSSGNEIRKRCGRALNYWNSEYALVMLGDRDLTAGIAFVRSDLHKRRNRLSEKGLNNGYVNVLISVFKEYG